MSVESDGLPMKCDRQKVWVPKIPPGPLTRAFSMKLKVRSGPIVCPWPI